MNAPAGLTAPQPSGRVRPLLLIAALFAIPFAIAALLYVIGWRPATPGHHGELVADADALPADGLLAADGGRLPADALAGRWLLLVAEAGPCLADCEARLATVHRLHVALNKQMPRLHRVWLSPAPAGDARLAALRTAYPDLVVAAPRADAWRALLPATATSPRVYVIDPAGRVVLRYPEPFDARGALHDVERLLRYSWIG